MSGSPNGQMRATLPLNARLKNCRAAERDSALSSKGCRRNCGVGRGLSFLLCAASMLRGVPLRRFLQGAALLLSGCSDAAPLPAETATQSSIPIVVKSSTDFGCVSATGARVSRIVKLFNQSSEPLYVSRWKPSCECLSIHPTSIIVPSRESVYVLLQLDTTGATEQLDSNLRMTVEAFTGRGRVAEFVVLAALVAPERLAHLDELLTGR